MASENDLPGGEALRIALRVIYILEGLGTPAWIGGSLASSIFGIPRATQDADIVADLQAESVPAFVHQLGKDFYADSERILMGVERLSSFNVIHLATMFKVDVFLLGSSPWALEELQRHRCIELGPEKTPAPVASPEDIVLHKLVWFRQGNHVADRQWRDALGVVQVQRDRLDIDYLAATAKVLEIADLLDELLAEASIRKG